MSQRNILIFSILFILTFTAVIILNSKVKSDLFSKKQELALFEKEAKELSALKRKYKDKKAVSRDIKNLSRIAKITKDVKKSKTRLLEFDNLSYSKLDALIRKIQNSSLIIKNFELIRKGETNAMVRLEILK